MTFTGTESEVAVKPRRPRMSKTRRREARTGYLFISPWLVGFLLFSIVPMVASAVLSFTNFNLATPGAVRFIGLDNWTRMLFDDPEVWHSLWVTSRFALISLPIGLTLSFGLAVLLNSSHLFGRNFFRTAFYAPSIVPFVAAVLIWGQVLNSNTGWLNRILEVFGIDAVGVNGIQWMTNPTLIPFTYTFIGIWAIGNAIRIYLAALQGVPTALYEAAEIDGAGWWRRLRTISIPMLTPVIFYNLVLGTIGLLQYFLPPYVLSGPTGNPAGSTMFFMIYFYKQAFQFSNMGYAAALAWLLFFFGLAITLVLFGLQKRWVFYAGAD